MRIIQTREVSSSRKLRLSTGYDPRVRRRDMNFKGTEQVRQISTSADHVMRGLPRAFASTFVKDTAVADPRCVAPYIGPADPRSSGMPTNVSSAILLVF